MPPDELVSLCGKMQYVEMNDMKGTRGHFIVVVVDKPVP